MNLEGFKRDIEDFAESKLLELDTKIERIEEKLTGIDFEENIFFLKKRLSRIELNKFGYSLDTDDNGREN